MDMALKQEQAETLALGTLEWIANDPEVTGQFLGWSGASIDDLRNAGSSPELMLAILEFILLQDDWVIGASEHLGLPPEKFASIKFALPGGEEAHWT